MTGQDMGEGVSPIHGIQDLCGGGGVGVGGVEIGPIVGTLLKNHYLCHCQADSRSLLQYKLRQKIF